MFGSNFFGQFGIPEMQPFPYQGADAQGGMLGPNAPIPGQNTVSQNDAGPGTATPIAGQPSPAGPAALGPSSPLSPAPLLPGGSVGQARPGASGGMTTGDPAPAAGIGSQFGGQHG